MLGADLSLLRFRDKIPRMNPKLVNFGKRVGVGKEEFYILFPKQGRKNFIFCSLILERKNFIFYFQSKKETKSGISTLRILKI